MQVQSHKRDLCWTQKFTEEGLQPDPEETDAVRKMPPPEDRAALLRFLGMMNYLSKFINTYSEKMTVLGELLHNDVIWDWTESHQQAFDSFKKGACKTSSTEFLWSCEVRDPVGRCIQRWTGCSMPPGRGASGVCFTSIVRCRDKIYTNRKGASSRCLCMPQVSWLYLWSASDHRDRPQASDQHCEEAS